MNYRISKTIFQLLWLALISFAVDTVLYGQNRQLIWAEEFDGPDIDQTVWQFESGPSNDNIHYYTDRIQNAKIVDGKLQLIALKENFKGYEYTSANIRSEHAQYWKYGRIEASIKLPQGSGFVPAFWMLPEDNTYGWWPVSGEIDIMEHPTNEKTKIYGTVHTHHYNLIYGPLPQQGGIIDIPDAESAFHLYAIEWSPEKIDFFVDDQKYFTFQNNGADFSTWPFNQSFFIILNLAVGGGWVGIPPNDVEFPVVMEVDFVRVYQHLQELSIKGPDYVTYLSENIPYSLSTLEETNYAWVGIGGDETIHNPHSPNIFVDYGIFSSNLEAIITTQDGSFSTRRPVKVTSNLLKNSSFEKGVKYWHQATGYPARGNLWLHTAEAFHREQSLHIEVFDPGGNPWDVQLSQRNIVLSAGKDYQISFWAKTNGSGNQISVAVIRSSDFSLIDQQTFALNDSWTYYEFELPGINEKSASLNFDFGGRIANYFLDEIKLTTDELKEMNLVQNPDFFDLTESWQLTNLSGAQASGEVLDGEYRVSIQNGGTNVWDIHLGQDGLDLAQGYEYTFSFDAYAESPREIIPLVGKNMDPWTVYHDLEPVMLSTDRNTYTFTFTMEEPNDPQSRLGFDIGGNESSIFFDNILLRKGTKTSTNSQIIEHNPTSKMTVFPNPAHSSAWINLILTEPSSASIKLNQVNGQELDILVQDFLQPGEYRFFWDASTYAPGLYFCELRLDGIPEVVKIIVTH